MNLKGLGVAMVTPFNPDLSIDFTSLARLTEDLIAGGVDFLVVMGTTGESVTLNKQEKQAALDCVLAASMGRTPVVYGMGGNNTAAVCEELRTFDFEGVSAILSVSPSYNKPTQEGIYQHFKALGEASPLPIILYNVPSRTSSNVEAETCLRIARDVKNVQAVKEASGDMTQINQIMSGAPEGFLVFSGDDGLTVPIMKSGGVGIISVIGNALPDLFSTMVHHAENKDYAKAEELDEVIQPLLPLLFKEGNPAGLKALMEIKNGYSDTVRLPLVAASDSLREELKQALKGISELV